MNSGFPFNPGNFDPSQMDPKVLMEFTQLVQSLPPDQISKMQSLMHNAMAGFDVRKEVEEFERSLPPGFREKVFALMSRPGAQSASGSFQPEPVASTVNEAPLGQSSELGVQEARLTVLKAVADGRMSPEEAERLLFS